MNSISPTEDEKPRKLDLRVWWQILGHARNFWSHGVGLAVMVLIIASSEVLIPFLTGCIIDDVKSHGAARLVPYSLIYVATVVTLCGGILGYILIAGRIATGVSHDIRQKSFAKLQQLSFAYFDRRPIGWLMSRLTSDCDRLSRIIGWTLLDFLWGTSMVLGIALFMFWLYWPLALVVLTVVPPLVVISLLFQRRLLEMARAIRKNNAEITAMFDEGIMGVRTTKVLTRESEALAEFEVPSGEMFQHSVRSSILSSIYVPMVLALGSAMAGIALCFGGSSVLGGTITIGTLVAFMHYAALFFDPIYEMARQFTELQMAQAAAERIQGLLDTEPAIKDSEEVEAKLAKWQTDHRDGLVAADGGEQQIRSIEFRDVAFSYQQGEPVLQDFNLRVAAGETIALVGATGGGKSTIVNLLCRFYEPTAGQILLNGTDYRQRSLRWLQENLGIVLQTPHLFSGSVRENIRYGNLQASDDDVERAAKLVDADQFIMRLRGEYAFDVGEGGNRLSTGQKQLVALARAILADPQIFIMDEATSAVDTKTEHLIQHAIEQVLAERTSFVIAHRLSTIRSADRILVIDGGRIVELGDHQQLLDRRGVYFQLHHESQLVSSGSS